MAHDGQAQAILGLFLLKFSEERGSLSSGDAEQAACQEWARTARKADEGDTRTR